ncbi:MAG: Na+/H+ antiporter NhaA, partial [Deltaproteobacteria bacterium]|nr:Na+/H+ antiporter NhaA [Deltaproteobacteria bacterium]
LGAILVIAIFYSEQISMLGLAIAGGGLVILLIMRRSGARPGPLDLFALAPLWIGLLVAGIHPTLAGVIVGLSTPASPWLSREVFGRIAEDCMDEYRAKTAEGADEHELIMPLRRLSVAGREAMAGVVRGEAQFSPWVAYFIMPLFALANAGVSLGGVNFDDAAAMTVTLGVALGLSVGKPLGVVGAGWLAVKMGLCTLPRGVSWGGMLIVGLTAGIGFTMAIFIAELAFLNEQVLLGLSKLAILMATAFAGIAALILAPFVLKKEDIDPTASQMTPAQVESSTEF